MSLDTKSCCFISCICYIILIFESNNIKRHYQKLCLANLSENLAGVCHIFTKSRTRTECKCMTFTRKTERAHDLFIRRIAGRSTYWKESFHRKSSGSIMLLRTHFANSTGICTYYFCARKAGTQFLA